ncbi:MAG: GatB/YqeY domain-containing protein [Patescibacteria group bacterium]
MDIKVQVQSELTAALKNREDLKLQTLRLLSNAIHNEEIAQGKALDEAEIYTVIKREVKKRKEAVESFQTGGRPEQAAKEEAESKILEAYLPAAMSEEEILKVVEAEIAANPGVKTGQIIGAVMKKIGNQADGTVVAKLINAKLS